MSLFVNTRQSPGLNRPFNNFPPDPIILNRPPTVNDRGSDFGQLWIQNQDSLGNILSLVWVFTNPGVWTQLTVGGAAPAFTSLAVTTGPVSLTGTTTVNTAGAAVTSIGTGGTGAVNIGNATGNTFITGNITATGAVTGATIYASGDLGGVVAQTSLTNVTSTAAGAGTVTFAANGTGNIAQTGWIKMYVGAVPVFVPYFNSIA